MNASTTNVDGLQLLSGTKDRIEKYFNKKITALKVCDDFYMKMFCKVPLEKYPEDLINFESLCMKDVVFSFMNSSKVVS